MTVEKIGEIRVYSTEISLSLPNPMHRALSDGIFIFIVCEIFVIRQCNDFHVQYYDFAILVTANDARWSCFIYAAEIIGRIYVNVWVYRLEKNFYCLASRVLHSSHHHFTRNCEAATTTDR